MRHLIFLLLFAAALPAFAAFEVPGFELVTTIPVDTALPNPDLRETEAVWCEMIDGAQKTLDFEEQYASSKPGEPLEHVIERMEAAGKRGVKIRFLLDKKMLRATYPETVERLKKIPGLDFRLIDFSQLVNDSIVHAKYFVVDGKQAFVGSQNFDWRSLKHVHESGLLVSEAAIAAKIQSVFNQDWKAAGLLAAGKKAPPLNLKTPPAAPGERAYLVASPAAYNPKGVPDSEAELVRLIGRAEKEIRIQLLDYSPSYRDHSYYAPIDLALRAAAARKVKVKLMVSHWNQVKPEIDYIKSLAVLPGIEVKIVTLPHAKEGFIPFARVNHSKIMEIDGKIAWVGTSNWSGGYLDRVRNLELVVQDAKLATRLEALHEQLWSSPYAANVEILKDYPPPEKGEEKK
jgi:phosphatidylserine/phosphatidylglycerophosphate/cardiolipin synthase-like enzyme